MPIALVCDSQLDVVGNNTDLSAFHCASGFQAVEFQNDAILQQLVLLNTFDPLQAAAILGFFLLIFITGFVTGVVIKTLRRT